MTSRRAVVRGGLAAGIGLLAACGRLPGRAAPVRRIGYLDVGNGASFLDGFRDGLREAGYVDGQNVVLEVRDAAGELPRLPALAAGLVGIPVEVIVARGIPSVAAAMGASSTIPIVASASDVVAAGLVKNAARPEGNLTGVSDNIVETTGKWIELLKETLPHLARVAAVLDAGNPIALANLASARSRAAALGLRLTPYDLRDLGQLPAVLATAGHDGADGLVMINGGALGGNTHPRIGAEALASRLPSISAFREFSTTGGLLSYGANIEKVHRRSATYVGKILSGARPGDLPVEWPTTYDLTINLRTAEALGLTIPPSILQQATEVIG